MLVTNNTMLRALRSWMASVSLPAMRAVDTKGCHDYLQKTKNIYIQLSPVILILSYHWA